MENHDRRRLAKPPQTRQFHWLLVGFSFNQPNHSAYCAFSRASLFCLPVKIFSGVSSCLALCAAPNLRALTSTLNISVPRLCGTYRARWASQGIDALPSSEAIRCLVSRLRWHGGIGSSCSRAAYSREEFPGCDWIPVDLTFVRREKSARNAAFCVSPANVGSILVVSSSRRIHQGTSDTVFATGRPCHRRHLPARPGKWPKITVAKLEGESINFRGNRWDQATGELQYQIGIVCQA